MFRIITILVSLLLAGNVVGQGWERIVSGGGQDGAQAVVNTLDGGFLLGGYYGATKIFVTKVTSDGKTQWAKNYLSGGAIGSINAIAATPDSGYIAAGWVRQAGPFTQSDGYLFKIDASGNVEWTKAIGLAKDDYFTGVQVTASGDILLCGYQAQADNKDNGWMIKTTPNGTTIWQKNYGEVNTHERIRGFASTDDGEIVCVGEWISTDGNDVDIWVTKTDTEGEVVWSNNFGFDLSPTASANDRGLCMTLVANEAIVIGGTTTALVGPSAGVIMMIAPDGLQAEWFHTYPKTTFNSIVKTNSGDGYFIGGMIELSNSFEDLYILKTDANGNQVWDNHIGRGGSDIGYSIVPTADGGVAIAGLSSPSLTGSETNAYLVKTDSNGLIFTNFVKGKAFHDLNNNCQNEINEPGLHNWIVKIASDDIIRYASTDSEGKYEALVDTGNYTITLFYPNQLWNACDNEVNVTMDTAFGTVQVPFAAQISALCPRNEIDIEVPVLQRCAENTYQVRYCNSGTMPSANTRIEVTLDPYLTLTGSSIPAVELNEGLYSFNVGFLNTNNCGNFNFTALLDCDSTITGQTHCVSAHIYPDTICTPAQPNWNGAIIEARATCENGTVNMYLRNSGTALMDNPVAYIIVEDLIMIAAPQDIQLLTIGQDSLVYSTPANGSTFRIIADQIPGYPGISFPTAAVEGCTPDNDTTSLGYYTMFPQDDANAFVEYSCQESIGPNAARPTFFKRGLPKGYDIDHFIQPTTDLQYLIQFSNTDLDTVKTVIVRDTLSPWLDPATVYPGAVWQWHRRV
jgi:hypothetical protein